MCDVRVPPSKKVIMLQLQQEVYLKQNSKPTGWALSTSIGLKGFLSKKNIHIYEWTHMRTHGHGDPYRVDEMGADMPHL